MNYALIEDGIVANIIYLHPINADEFKNAVSIGDLPIQIGDTYADGKFYRDGKKIILETNTGMTEQEFVNQLIAEVKTE